MIFFITTTSGNGEAVMIGVGIPTVGTEVGLNGIAVGSAVGVEVGVGVEAAHPLNKIMDVTNELIVNDKETKRRSVTGIGIFILQCFRTLLRLAFQLLVLTFRFLS